MLRLGYPVEFTILLILMIKRLFPWSLVELGLYSLCGQQAGEEEEGGHGCCLLLAVVAAAVGLISTLRWRRAL